MNTYYLVRIYYDYKCQSGLNLYDPIKNEYFNAHRGELTISLTQNECNVIDWIIKNNLLQNTNFTKLFFINYLLIDYTTYQNNLKFMQKEYQTVNSYYTFNYIIQDYLSKLISYYLPQYQISNNKYTNTNDFIIKIKI